MNLNSTLPKLLGVCFYHSPASDVMQSVFPVLPELVDLFPWENPQAIEALIADIQQIAPENLQYDYSILFEGQGNMPAPPWGSYYLEVDQLLMGETTLKFRDFLHGNGIQLATEHKEPEDQFGLMLIALSILLDQKDIENAHQLLHDFLLSWAFRYLNAVQNTALEHNFYPNLAKIAKGYLQQLKLT